MTSEQGLDPRALQMSGLDPVPELELLAFNQYVNDYRLRRSTVQFACEVAEAREAERRDAHYETTATLLDFARAAEALLAPGEEEALPAPGEEEAFLAPGEEEAKRSDVETKTRKTRPTRLPRSRKPRRKQRRVLSHCPRSP